MSHQILLNNKQMHKKLLMDYSPKDLFTPSGPGIFVEMLWKPGSDLRSVVSIVSGFLGENQWTTNPPLVRLGVCSEDSQSEEISLKQTLVQSPSQKQVCGIKKTYWLSQPSPLPTPGYTCGPCRFQCFSQCFPNWTLLISLRKFSSRFHCPKICSALLPTFSCLILLFQMNYSPVQF